LLFIKRLGKWDLPKGKLEKNESPEQGALREIMEECLIENLSILKKLPSTYHVYQQNEKEYLKITHWYKVHCKKYDKMQPQTEEGITELKWFSLNDLEEVFQNTYASIYELVKTVIN